MVGESGAGKSMTGNAVIGLLEPPGRVAAGTVSLAGRRIDNLGYEAIRKVRGREIGAIFQDPLTSLNPALHRRRPDRGDDPHPPRCRRARRAGRGRWRCSGEVGIPAAAERIDHYPHQFSGGMRQRVVIALALCAEPRLIIADEPTTALDVSIQAQIIRLLKRLSAERGTAILLITHDMGVIAEPRRPGGGDVRRTDRRDRPGARGDQAPQAPLYPRAHEGDSGARARGRQPRPDSRRDAAAARDPRRLRLSSRAAPTRSIAAGGNAPTSLPPARPRPPAGCTARPRTPVPPMAEAARDRPGAAPALLKVEDLSCYFDVSPPLLNRTIEGTGRRIVHAVDGVSFAIRPGRDLLAGGRVRLRQVDRGPSDRRSPPAQQRDRHLRWRRSWQGARRRRRGGQTSAHADDLPGPLRLAQPALAGARHRRRADSPQPAAARP